MKCFNHDTNDAVALCKACGKALCHDCAVDITLGFACNNEACISRARMINEMLANNAKVTKTANKQIKAVGISGLFISAGFLFFAVISYLQMPDSFLAYFLGTLGVVFLISSIMRLRKKERYPEAKD